MGSSNRRTVLSGIAAAGGLSLLGLPVRLAAKSRTVEFPSKPFRLRRVLERDLGQGAQLSVQRDWRCRFDPAESGAQVVGAQTRCSVIVPPALSALGEIERKREVTGLFPMQLDANGIIRGWEHDRPLGIAAALEQARKRIASLPLEAEEKRDAQTYLAAVAGKAAELVSTVPRDLFFPATGTRTETRALILGGGLKGSYEVTVSARSQAASSLLAFSERRIVTRIGDSERLAREHWSVVI